MIRIVLPNHEELTLSKSKIKIQLKSPVFQNGNEPSSRMFDFKIPYSVNVLKLSNYCNWQSRGSYQQIDVKVYLSGSFYSFAKLDIVSHTHEEITVRLLLDKAYYIDFANKKLNEFRYAEPYPFRFYLEQLPFTEYFFDDIGVSGITTITFTFFRTTNTGAGSAITKTFTYNPTTETIVNVINKVKDWFNSTIEENRYLVVPVEPIANDFVIYNLTTSTFTGFYFTITASDPNFVISTIGSTSKSRLSSSQSLYEQNLLDADSDFKLFPIHNKGLFSYENPSYLQYINLYSPKITGNAFFPGRFFSDSQPLCPQPNLKYLFYKIHQEYGIEISSDVFFNDIEIAALHLLNYKDILNTNLRPANGWLYQQTATFYYSDIVPNTTVKTLLYALKSMFGLVVSYSSRNRNARVLTIKDILKSNNRLDISKKVVKSYNRSVDIKTNQFDYKWPMDNTSEEKLPVIIPNQVGASVNFKSNLPTPPVNGFLIVFASKENKHYKWNSVLSQWEEYSEDFYPTSTNQEVTQEISASPLFTSEVPWVYGTIPSGLPNNLKWLTPLSDEVGNQLPTDNVEEKIRLVFYRGIRNCSIKPDSSSPFTTGQYPFASSHNYDFERNKVGNYSLSLNHEDGLLKNWLKEWLDFLNTKTEFRFKVDWDLVDIFNLDLLTKIQVENQEFLIDTVEFEVEEDISNVVITCNLIKPTYE